MNRITHERVVGWHATGARDNHRTTLSMRMRCLVAMFAVGIAGCSTEHTDLPTSRRAASSAHAGQVTAASADRHAVGIAFGDSVTYHNDFADGVLYRVTVRSALRTDTIPGVLVEDLPVVGNDGRVYGIRWEENEAAGPFVYDPATHRTTRLPKPDGWWEYGTPALAPDGSHVAYLARTGEGTGEARVAALPSERVVYRGPEARLLPSDAGVDQIAWRDADHFDVRIQLEQPVGASQRVRGSTDGVHVSVDTLNAPATE